MFNPAAYENSRPDGLSVMEIVEELPPPQDQPRRFVPLKRTELTGEIAGPLASLRLVQTFGTWYGFDLEASGAYTIKERFFEEWIRRRIIGGEL